MTKDLCTPIQPYDTMLLLEKKWSHKTHLYNLVTKSAKIARLELQMKKRESSEGKVQTHDEDDEP